MTAQEIRQKSGSESYWLREIAAQLAELNSRLKASTSPSERLIFEVLLCASTNDIPVRVKND